jgi:hypothetical protein
MELSHFCFQLQDLVPQTRSILKSLAGYRILELHPEILQLVSLFDHRLMTTWNFTDVMGALVHRFEKRVQT